MPIYSWPSDKWGWREHSFRVLPITQNSASPYTGTSKSSALGNIWVCSFTIPEQSDDNAFELQSFLDLLEGPVNPVQLYDRKRQTVRALMNAAPILWSGGITWSGGVTWSGPAWSTMVSVAAPKGQRSVSIDGFPALIPVLYKGDKFGINGYLYEVTDNVKANVSGVALVQFIPGLRQGVADGDPVVLTRPAVKMRMTPDSDQAVRHGKVNTVGGMSLDFVEAIDL